MITKPKCGPDMPVGEWCEGDGSCGTDDQANSCFFWEEIYTRLDCSLTPSPPPPPLDPRPPAGPGESAFLPAPPPPANGVLGQGAADDGDNGFFGPISLAWFIVILVWALLTPVLICVLCYYARLKGWCCYAGLSSQPQPQPQPQPHPHPSPLNLQPLQAVRPLSHRQALTSASEARSWSRMGRRPEERRPCAHPREERCPCARGAAPEPLRPEKCY